MAYECSPYRGSEWAAGWGRVLGAAKVAETHVVTSEANFAALERARTEGLLPANVFFYTPAPDAKLRSLDRNRALFAYNYTAYHYWQLLAFKLVRELHDREHFDLVHQVSVCTFREPGYGWKLPVPFVWGPVGGTQNFPARFLPMLPPAEAVKEGIRSFANWFALRKPRVREAARHASVLIGSNSTNVCDMGEAFGRDVERLLETGLYSVREPDRSRFEARIAAGRAERSPGPLRMLWSGELQTRKALPVLLRALARVGPQTSWQLEVVGDGPMRARWAAEAERLGLADRVHFLGRLPFEEAVEKMNSAELFCFTSLRDTSGNVVLEALAAGVPVLCFDHQGGGDMVTEYSGIKLPVASPQKSYADWAQAIETLARDHRKLFALSRGATIQARKFLWSRNHDRVNEVYEQLVNEPQASVLPSASRTQGEDLFGIPLGAGPGSSR